MSAILGLMAHASLAAGAAGPCGTKLTRKIAPRPAAAPAGEEIADGLMGVEGVERDAAVSAQILAGNIPSFLRRLQPVDLTARLDDGAEATVTICVMPDYLAVGSDRDFVRMPMGLPAAAEIADRFGFMLPTPRMVDAIYAEASVQLTPSPMPPTNRMRSTDYLLRHNETVEGQRAAEGASEGTLMAGQKKDLVLTNRLRKAPGRVAIYGWHRRNGKPIQPLSTVHGETYADYSHGVRLVSATAFMDGKPVALARLLQSAKLWRLVSREGPIADAAGLLASLERHDRRVASAGD